MILKTQSLTPTILQVVRDKGTEKPFFGEYDTWKEPGTFLCRMCGQALFRSTTKFSSGCGWPSFDEEIPNRIKQQKDPDGARCEIVCARCNAHMGHVFFGENFSDKNTRHCVNSLSLDFVPDLLINDTEEAIFAGGCFWGLDYYLKQLPGVLKTEVGYSGGHKAYPSYEEVCTGATGHYEAVRVVYDPNKINYENIAKYFFEIHNPCQSDGQGPDRGEQYLSVAFYYDAQQKKSLEKLIQLLENKQYKIATKVLPVKIFWKAEEYHQSYYEKHNKLPYCHRFQEKF